jgi:hypothetical protein
MALVFKSVVMYGWKRGGLQMSVVAVGSLPFIDTGIPVPCAVSGVWQAQHYVHILYSLSGGPTCEMPV